MTAPPIQEKPAKSNKKAPPTKEELHKMTVGFSRLCQQQKHHVYIWPSLSDLLFFLKAALVVEYNNSKNTNEAVNAVKEMKPPKHFLPEMLNKIVVHSLDRSDDDKELASVLIHELCTEGVITSDQLLQVCFRWVRFNITCITFTVWV